MSVPFRNRKQSSLEFLSNFHRLRKDIIMWLCRDFGFKKREYTFDFVKKIYELDNRSEEELREFVKCDNVLGEKYPEWLIKSWRDSIMDTLNNIGKYIEIGNSIYVADEESKKDRVKYISLSIGYCNALKDKINEIILFTNRVGGCVKIIGEELEKEIVLLKGLKKRTKVLSDDKSVDIR